MFRSKHGLWPVAAWRVVYPPVQTCPSGSFATTKPRQEGSQGGSSRQHCLEERGTSNASRRLHVDAGSCASSAERERGGGARDGRRVTPVAPHFSGCVLTGNQTGRATSAAVVTLQGSWVAPTSSHDLDTKSGRCNSLLGLVWAWPSRSAVLVVTLLPRPVYPSLPPPSALLTIHRRAHSNKTLQTVRVSHSSLSLFDQQHTLFYTTTKRAKCRVVVALPPVTLDNSSLHSTPSIHSTTRLASP